MAITTGNIAVVIYNLLYILDRAAVLSLWKHNMRLLSKLCVVRKRPSCENLSKESSAHTEKEKEWDELSHLKG